MIFIRMMMGVNHIRIHARPNKWHEDDCPFCHKHCRRYDRQSSASRVWRGLDWGRILVEVDYHPHRIECPVHGVLVADVPWAYPGSGFTRDFDLTVGWLATYLPRSTVSEYMRIDWEQYAKYAGYGVSGMLKFESSTSQPKTYYLSYSERGDDGFGSSGK